jgi:hypothetical protein
VGTQIVVTPTFETQYWGPQYSSPNPGVPNIRAQTLRSPILGSPPNIGDPTIEDGAHDEDKINENNPPNILQGGRRNGSPLKGIEWLFSLVLSSSSRGPRPQYRGHRYWGRPQQRGSSIGDTNIGPWNRGAAQFPDPGEERRWIVQPTSDGDLPYQPWGFHSGLVRLLGIVGGAAMIVTKLFYVCVSSTSVRLPCKSPKPPLEHIRHIWVMQRSNQ